MWTPFASLFERRDGGSPENPSVSLADALFGDWDKLTSSGQTISDEKAASVPDVFSCIQVLSQDVGRCPLKLRQIADDGSHSDALEHPMWELLADLSNPETTAYQFRLDMQRNLLTYNKAYAEIIRNGRGEVVSLWTLDPRYMKVTRNSLNQKVWTYQATGMKPIVWTFHPSVPPIFELSHLSPISQCRDLIGMAYALDLFGAKFFANGSRPSGTLETPPGAVLDEQVRGRLKDAFSRLYSGAENAGKVALMEGGVKFTPITIANNEAQYNETRKFIRTLIAGAFRMPPHKIGDLERATFSNIEQQSIDYVTGTLDPFLVSWEQSIRRDLLTTRQFPGYLAVFDRAALIKADIASLFNAFAIARQNGWMNANDILKELGRNPIPGKDGDTYLVNAAMVPAGQAGQQPTTSAEPGAAA